MTQGRRVVGARQVNRARGSPLRIRLGSVLRVSIVLAFFLGLSDSARAQSPAAPDQPIRPRFLFVDADHPSTWPKGLEPIAAGEFRRLLGGTSDPDFDRSVQIEQAVYRATLRDGAVLEGQADFSLGKIGAPTLVTLERPHAEPFHLLEFSHLRWQDDPHDRGPRASNDKEDVLCGIGPAGRRVLIADAGRSRLSCDWSLAGRRSQGATEFAICLPPAVVSQIVLQVPDELSLECDQGVLVRGTNDSDGRTRLWQLELGSRSCCRLRVIASSASEKQRVFYDQDTTFVVALGRLRVQSKLQLEVFGAPLRTLRLAVPAGVRLEAISYGDEFPLPFPATSPDKAREISLDLPEAVLGKSRTILVEASAATRANLLSNLPQIDLPGAVRREGQVQLTVRAPLKLVRFGGDAGLAQSEAPTYSTDGEETFLLRQSPGDSPLAIEVAEPAPALASRTLARLDLRRDRCAFAADVVCSASRGSTFSVTFELPDVWEVTRVEAIGDASRMIDETSRAVAEHRKRVKVDFFRAVTDREPKRFRIEASRPLPHTGEAIEVPVIEFPAFASQEVETLIVHDSAIELGLTPAEAFAAFNPTAIFSALADSPLKPDRTMAADTQMLTHRWTNQAARARITLRRGEEMLAARVRTTVEGGASQQISERIDATLVPTTPLDHVLMYLATEGSRFAWSVSTNAERPIDGSRLASARHAEWNLPEGGELWEFRLPEPFRTEFHLKGTRRTSAMGGAKIGLAFIPGAPAFDGAVELHLGEGQQFEVESREARTMTPVPSRDPSVRSFHYDEPGEVLVVRPRSIGISKGAARFASLRLTSYLDAGGADDFHRAEFSIAPEISPRPFHFLLDADSRLCSVTVNGQPVRAQRRDNDVVLPSPPAESRNQVIVEYKTSAPARLFGENRPVDIPRAQAEILDFHWRIFLAPSLQPGGLSSGLRFDQALPSLSWAERLFGPLGRTSAQMRLSSFKPDAWIVDLAGVDAESAEWTPTDRPKPYAGWSSWETAAEQIPSEVSVTIWHAGKLRTLAWIVCLGFLIAGLVIARFAPWEARRLGPLVVALATAVAIAAPSPYAILAGACVSGSILCVLLSRPWKSIAAPRPPAEHRESRPGSTVSFELRAVGVLLILATFGGIAAFAQPPVLPPVVAPRREAPPQFPPGDARQQAAPAGDLLMVIPVHPAHLHNGATATLPDDKELVYVSPAAMVALSRRAQSASRNEGIVLLSSDYALSLDERQPATIDAAYRVAVMPGATRSLFLPLANVTLAGASACRVDGQPYPIRKDDAGFVLLLDPNAPSRPAGAPLPTESGVPAERKAILAARPSLTAGPAVSNVAPKPEQIGRPRVCEIHLTCFPTGGAKPDQFELQVPETPHTTVGLSKSGPWQVVTVEAGRGRGQRLRAGEPPIDVRQTDHVRIKAGPSPFETSNATINAQAVELWRVAPGLVEMDCRVTYDRVGAAPAKFTWLVPARASVRTAGEAYLASLGSVNKNGRGHSAGSQGTDELVPLDFDCSAAPEGSLTIAATLLLPVDLSERATSATPPLVPLPRFGVPSADQTSVVLSSNQVGLSAVAGYRVAATTEPNLAHTTTADPAFRQDSFGARKEPDLIFDCQGVSALPLQLSAVFPAHKVRLMMHEARVSADRIQWKTTAEIRTENAPAFVHTLRVDPHLKVDSVSVREDDVERLVRYSQSGDAVTLFLRDRAAATQDLVLTGHFPLEAGHATRLPGVSLVHAQVSEVRLAISHDPDVDVHVSDSPGVARASAAAPSTSAGRAKDAARTPEVLEYSVSSSARMPEIRVTRRPETAQAAQNRGVAARKSPVQSRPAQRPLLASTQQGPKVDVVTTLEVRGDRSSLGATNVLLDRFAEPSLRLSWPAALHLRGAVVDERPVQPLVGSGWISIAIPSEPIPHRIALHWETPAGSSLRALAHIRQELPVPVDARASSLLLSVAVPPGFRLWEPAHFTPIDPGTFAGLARAIEYSERKTEKGDLSANVGSALPETTSETRLTGRLDGGAADATLSAWAVETLWLRLPLAVAIFALIAILAAHPHAARGAAWFLSRAPLTLGVLGLLWWFCLAPRAVGPLLLVVALAMLIIDLRRRDSSHSVPSTLHIPAKFEAR